MKAAPKETKAAVMAALLAGQGVNETARAYNLNPSTVSRWKDQLGSEEMQELIERKRDEFGDMLTNYLKETLKTLAIQVQHFRNTDWLAKQGADSLAVLHGVLVDKVVRLLEALERAGEESSQPQ